ncbi:MAG: 2-amino-4-hydroxy-6-hydroxymethyldihydropteridine diphosphokinase [Kiritimatiellae bacterium]|nr:2-amino-4-hydroxy-6-hydroxymethyldihydropteridine diphosphokinase [Kiritimatiellia bacterium]
MTAAVIALGSNLGERQDWLAFAADRLSAAPEVRIVKRSGIFETDPVGVPEQFKNRKFLNQVLMVETGLDAAAFSRLVHRIEDEAGRKRGPVRNSPRTLDVDIITFGGLISSDPELTLPHPRAKQRVFVLEPLAQIAPDFRFPDEPDVTVTQLLEKIKGTSA